LKPAIYFNSIILPVGPSALAPADDYCFDWALGFHTVPGTVTPPAQKRDDIGADVILAEKLKRLVGRWDAFMREGPDSLLPCRHAILRVRPLRTPYGQ
jgi:hypothetical protein